MITSKPPPLQRKVTGWAGKKQPTEIKPKKKPNKVEKTETLRPEDAKPGLQDPPCKRMYAVKSVSMINMQGNRQMTMDVINEATNESCGSSFIKPELFQDEQKIQIIKSAER